jgi:hypothetical protein
VNAYDDGTAKNNNNSSSAAAATDAAAMGQMDPAWLAYYQSVNYYNMMQTGTPGSTPSASSTNTATAKPSDSTTNTSNNNSTTPGL